jgi:hypothetical protein
MRSCKPTLVSRLASEYFDIKPGRFYDFRVLGIAECQDNEEIESETEPRALLLRSSARHNYELRGPRGRLIENPIDWRAVQQWINFCDEKHATSCIFEPESALKGLQFIDCETLQIVPSPERSPPYITLSYLWSRAGGLKQGSLSEDIPLVVEDAIKVVKELGWRYLWVDRYCIPQEDGPEKDNFIYNMDQIYRGATSASLQTGNRIWYTASRASVRYPGSHSLVFKLRRNSIRFAGLICEQWWHSPNGAPEVGLSRKRCFQRESLFSMTPNSTFSATRCSSWKWSCGNDPMDTNQKLLAAGKSFLTTREP